MFTDLESKINKVRFILERERREREREGESDSSLDLPPFVPY